ncbi:MAG: hypothetical protein KO202_07520 [Methanobacteriaceae archaeon]|jgi:hypothetical protein|nr:hypothetical protein [Methanobacteriaceae archaeon]
MKKINYKKIFIKFASKIGSNYKFVLLILSFLISGIILFIGFDFRGERYYTWSMLLICLITFGIMFFVILNSGNSKKFQTAFLIGTIIISFSTGALVNPVESGLDFYFDQPVIQETQKIVENDPNGIWVIEGNIFIDEILPVGARTLNSVNTYPNMETWSLLDPQNESYEVYNRYAHIPIILQNTEPTNFKLVDDHNEIFILTLNTEDLEKLNISYILTPNEIEHLSNNNLTFTKIYEDQNSNRIYKISYK